MYPIPSRLARHLTSRSGIIGLYTAYQLVESGVDGSQVLLIAEFMPGDESINYTSPYAGGNFSCISGDDAPTLQYDKYTYQNLVALQRKLGGPRCGLANLPSTEYWEQMPSNTKILSLKGYLQDYREIPTLELAPGTVFGIKFTTWNFNCPKFLQSLRVYLEARGVKFERRKLSHVSQAFLPGSVHVFNCTGIGARSLGGVDDASVYPTRGQVVVIKAPHIQESVMKWGPDSATYVIKRPYSHDQLILGGFVQKDDWAADTLKEQTDDILQRTTKLFPKILAENPGGSAISDLEILRVAAGLRPSRHGGARIEKTVVGGKVLIHNYGASGYGYQAGLGMASKAVSLAFGRANL